MGREIERETGREIGTVKEERLKRLKSRSEKVRKI
jgi:hypothetical protein